MLPMPTLYGLTKRSAGTSCVVLARMRCSLTLCVSLSIVIPDIYSNRSSIRKWISARVPNHTQNVLKPNISLLRRPTRAILSSTGFKWNMNPIYSHLWTNVIGGSELRIEGWRKLQRKMRRQQTWCVSKYFFHLVKLMVFNRCEKLPKSS